MLPISIITPSFNQGQYLEENIFSVLGQQYHHIQHIIIDGGSTDSTKEVLKQYEKQIAYSVSEPDNGQSDAINKGYAKAKGEIIGWLNSDDYYAPGALKAVAKAFEDPNINVVTGYSILFDEDGKQMKATPTITKDKPLEQWLRFPNINQPSTFFRKNVMDEIMPLNTSLHYLMDRELWLKYLLKYGIENVAVLDESLVYFRLHKDSKSVSQDEKFDSDYATMLYHIAKHNGLNDAADLLGTRYEISKDYSPSFSIYPTKETSLDMLRFFLVKRGGLVFTKPQFEFAKKAYTVFDIKHYQSLPEEKIGMYRLSKIASCINWFHFRVKRKIDSKFA
ncbi:MAG TPA: glycosyltransferase family 2 protein [Bacteroidia bacterium]|jgi:glycosyltransferase involved in cell wall biosynthesis|nr:glycosyltransferase family 2 protein [Bacteroidia bacterium]